MFHDPSTDDQRPWSRREWVAFADRLLAAAMRYGSAGNGRIVFPGDEGGYGRAVDGLEGFARTFLIAGFRIAGARGEGVEELVDFYARGIRTGVNPDAEDRWVRLDEHSQAKVEAASLALVLDLTRPWIWDRLDRLTQERVIAYLSPVVGDETYPRNNWLWFRIVVQTFLRSVGGPWSQSDIDEDLARHRSYRRSGGWFSDGDGNAYDHYAGWAMHLYPVLWARMSGAAEVGAGRIGDDVDGLDRYLQDALHLVGGDGSPLIQGRSLIYRFAAAAPFWAGVIAEVPSVSAGALRHAAERIVRHFDDRGAPDADDVLTMGWFGTWRQLAQSYSGPGSPYWAAKGLLGIMLPEDHPVWSQPSEPLPVERGDAVRHIAAPGWAVSGTAADGIVRIANHGTSRDAPGALVADSPLYARLGYSTATSPLLDERAWTDPLEQSIALVDETGAATHRSALHPLDVAVDDPTLAVAAASSWQAHVIEVAPSQQRHGSGYVGEASPVGTVTAVSVLRGPWEVRFARVDGIDDDRSWMLRWGGWPVPVEGALTGMLRPLGFEADAESVMRQDASPLAARIEVPTLTGKIAPGQWRAVELMLTGAGVHAGCSADISGDMARIIWPDGAQTTIDLPSTHSGSDLRNQADPASSASDEASP